MTTSRLVGVALLWALAGCSANSFSTVLSGEGMDRGVGLVATSDGGFIVTGVTTSLGSGTEDGLVLRLESDGEPVWVTRIDVGGDDAAWNAVEADGGFAVAGFSSEEGTNPDCTLTRIASTGETLWTREYGGPGRERCWSIAVVDGGGFVLAGEQVSEDETRHDCLLVRVDEDGEQRWIRTYDHGLQERCFAVATTDQGGFLVAGQTSPDGGDERDLFVFGTDADGELLYEHVVGEAGIDVGHGVVAVEGGVVVAGYSSLGGEGDVDPLLMKIDGAGEVVWMRTIPVAEHARGLSVGSAPNGDLCVGGFRITSEGETIPFVIRTDALGVQTWIRELGEFSIGYSAVADGTGRCVITGHTAGLDLDLFIARLSADGRPADHVSIVDVANLEVVE